ncbi:MAG TPA: hypothetical protein VFC72_03230, partial [Corynebacterium sp.]|nr:hypothetical protein [Corynebacterium sp.]
MTSKNTNRLRRLARYQLLAAGSAFLVTAGAGVGIAQAAPGGMPGLNEAPSETAETSPANIQVVAAPESRTELPGINTTAPAAPAEEAKKDIQVVAAPESRTELPGINT